VDGIVELGTRLNDGDIMMLKWDDAAKPGEELHPVPYRHYESGVVCKVVITTTHNNAVLVRVQVRVDSTYILRCALTRSKRTRP